MALTIKAAGDSKLVVNGTTTELSEIYARIEFACPKDGNKMGAALYCYENKAKYTADPGSLLSLEGFEAIYTVDIDIESEIQSLQTGHDKVKAALEAAGYTVTIIDL